MGRCNAIEKKNKIKLREFGPLRINILNNLLDTREHEQTGEKQSILKKTPCGNRLDREKFEKTAEIHVNFAINCKKTIDKF